MTTIGDSFSVVAILLGIGLTAWALVLSYSLIFIRRSQAAREQLEAHPWRAILLGLAVTGTLGVMGLTMIGSPLGPVKFLGIMVTLALGAIALVGMGGMAMLLAGRIRSMDQAMSHYGSLSRASLLLVFGTFFPVLGWMLVAPVVVATAVGLGLQCLSLRRTQPEASAWNM